MTKARDPVCGMAVDAETARFKGVYDAQTVYFCCEACQRSYERRPGTR